jgi:predicted TIM-barrel fold metal-dependent hydrolase
MDAVKGELIEYMAGLDVIDCHEHLCPEHVRLEREVDVLMLVSLYAFVDMLSAGFPPEERKTHIGNNHALDTSVPLEQRWHDLWPYIRRVKYGSYYRPTALALRDIYGIHDLNESTWREATERMRTENTKGLYHRVLRDRCKIRTCLVQNGRISNQDPPDLFTPLYSNTNILQFTNLDFVEYLKKAYSVGEMDLDTYLDCVGKDLEKKRKEGAVGFKIGAWRFAAPDMQRAREEFRKVLQGSPVTATLRACVLEFILRKAAEWDWPVAVHCGIWNDYRDVDPKNIIDTVMKHPGVRFDLYHLGMPFARDCIFIAKNFPNAYLNLCWCYAISQEITRRTINEILDTVPVNKVFGFGADYIYAVENVYGHLVMARETIAEALSERIARGHLDHDGAKEICRLWLHDNPAAFYRLKA